MASLLDRERRAISFLNAKCPELQVEASFVKSPDIFKFRIKHEKIHLKNNVAYIEGSFFYLFNKTLQFTESFDYNILFLKNDSDTQGELIYGSYEDLEFWDE